ncbi:type II secretion system GspH family protein [Corallococcus sp. M34]|uniref:PilW family protein n=1 Tax=Citreicoccus inhibens TaxID=2849499 RepID=UPI001C240ABA|nr:type II secretion system protein [Citreicoccus inhibens]MBU8896358.1 type II secretion system GspH family protein [Citreicoccus inhibens]
MMRRIGKSRGFTLLEVMVAAGLAVIVLATGLAVGMQMQRRAIFEEQTMMAQVTGKAVKDLLTTDIERAGLGMGNSPTSFGQNDQRVALSAWTEPNLKTTVAQPSLMADMGFSLPSGIYANMRSDALQLFWGDTQSMITLAPCTGIPSVREGGSDNYCTGPNPPMDLQPPTGQMTPALVVNPFQTGIPPLPACQILISSINSSSQKVNANPGTNSDTNDACSSTNDGRNKLDWRQTGWRIMRTLGAAYRVNWVSAGTEPQLEYLPPGPATSWQVVSRDVERMKVRMGVMDLISPNADLRWFPDAAAGRPAIDACTIAKMSSGECSLDSPPASGGPLLPLPTTDAGLVLQLRERVREVEITLTIRTRRADRDAVDLTAVDEEGMVKDGYKRRTFTFRVTPRNFAATGLLPPIGP